MDNRPERRNVALFVASRALDPDAPANAGTAKTKAWTLGIIDTVVASLGHGAVSGAVLHSVFAPHGEP